MLRSLFIVFAAATLISIVALSTAVAIGGRETLDPVAGRFSFAPRTAGPTMSWEGPAIVRQIEWSGADRLEIFAPAEVVFTQSEKTGITVRGPAQPVGKIVVEGGEIRLPGWMSNNEQAETEHLTIEVSGPSTTVFVMHIGSLSIEGYDHDRLEVELAKAGEVEASGRAATVQVRMRGFGEVDLSRVETEDADITLHGAGIVIAAPKDEADVELNGVGEVRLLTRPRRLSQRVIGFGKVTQKSEPTVSGAPSDPEAPEPPKPPSSPPPPPAP